MFNPGGTYMTVACLIIATLASVCWSLWIRRLTWRSSWERAATINVALQGLAVILMSPFASATLGEWLHSLTGQYNLEDYVGHDCYIVAASAAAFNVIGRLKGAEVQQRAFKLWVETPATLAVPLLLAVFTLSQTGEENYPDFFTAPTTELPWLRLYWLLLCVVLVWLLVYGSRATVKLLHDPRSRSIARVYLIASICGAAACLSRAVTDLATPGVQSHMISSLSIWVLASACGIGFALTSAYSWQAKRRWFKAEPVS
ncbi:hypothetical protein HUFFLYPUFF_56 [Mycobacterium phage HufflyPuff]|uniref:hypothetical protein n=1 Tax=Mycobacterium phage HufflyPuff TaxID=1430411 RepID=UPI0003C938B3|nr:hypothetical protein HUFFLYPUFF_56 [Mycobacterium phage HufflyPuff]AHB31224.1 hypothetical protein HUFFLYPUFF_56 [Mycobacterium phage HufflyPuff]ATN89153.1 hypothetical protein SEA_FIRERED_57 [Mycobacterium phage FireRed]AXH68527.1 hypothetical protein SEA_XKCD_58 [Mycobacterium phage xkcd]